MYPIPDAAKALFESEQRQILRITGADRNGVAINVTDADVQMNGFNIDRFSCNGSRLEIGTAISAEMTLNLDNRGGQFDGVIFEGAELFVEVGIADWSQADPTIYWIPCGYYTPDEQPRSLNTITLHALDRMMRFDVAVPQLGTPAPWVDADGNKITDANGNVIYFYPPVSNFPCTVEMLVRQACDICGVELAESIATLTNSQYMVRGLPDVSETVTFRNLIQWTAGLMGTNAYIDWNGQLRFDWYDGTSVYTTTTANRYSSDLYENDIAFTGVTFTDLSDVPYQAGTADYTLDLTGNYLIDSNTAQTAINALYARIGQFAYRPFEATVINAPWLWPMDAVTFTDKGGVQHASALTNVNFTINGNTVLKSSGETDKTSSYVPPASFTPRQAQALERARASTTAEIGTAVDNATRQITGAAGGYVRFIYDANNILTEIVIMDTDDIDTATKVWRWNSGGFGYSSTGYAGPYTTAITQDGSIVADFITSGEMSAERISGGTLKSLSTVSGTTDPTFLLNLATSQMQMMSSDGKQLIQIDPTSGEIIFGFRNNITDSFNTVGRIWAGTIGSSLPIMEYVGYSPADSIQYGLKSGNTLSKGMTVSSGSTHVQITGGLDVDGIDLLTPRYYTAMGLLDSANAEVVGKAVIQIVGKSVFVDFSAKIDKPGDGNTPNVGIPVSGLRSLSADLPAFTVTNGGVLTYYDANGAYSTSLNGYAGSAALDTTANRWNFGRVYKDTSDNTYKIGAWAADRFTTGIVITGRLLGTLS